ncbi:DUF72 domain-containing protein [Noviherbaspirillum galbum]|uniref:DUF72 domain-containing protein n=1 Tax=Noviherbaspirillum galbum TaxID=2709383 RepID=A0A6B3STI3_9BURK|nr:DUF72 domain-containing protein [Noviherbaspirillum galbum]NEX64290.1 DUF72 domain-containing protein [Noviherbaspirillum galbum]
MQDEPVLFLGCAGWSISSAVRDSFAAEGSQLERYASVFPAVEINSSFYRPHRPATYARWRDSVPAHFRFSAKIPRDITHVMRLRQADGRLDAFLGEVMHLEEKLGCLLLQLPPSLAFEPDVADAFLALLRRRAGMAIACEARHPSWFTSDAAALMRAHDVTPVLADPQVRPLPDDARFGNTVYIRLHGSPRMYYSAYGDADLERVAADIERHAGEGRQVWCVFDNTADGAAVPNALSLLSRLPDLVLQPGAIPAAPQPVRAARGVTPSLF